MTFLELYGDAIDTELGTSDRTQRFTVARRKLEINAAQREFVRLTNCYVRRATIPLVTLVNSYDLIAAITAGDFFRLTGAEQLPTIGRTIGDVTTYIAGEKDFPRRSPDWLDRNDPGWGSASADTPMSWFIRQDTGTMLISIHPPPLIAAGDSWSLYVPYVALPATMTADAAIPFSTGAATQTPLVPYHQALAHFAAGKLELLRKAYQASDRQMQLFAGFVAEYLESKRVEGPQHVQMHSYLAAANRRSSGSSGPDTDRIATSGGWMQGGWGQS